MRGCMGTGNSELLAAELTSAFSSLDSAPAPEAPASDPAPARGGGAALARGLPSGLGSAES